MSFSVKYCLLLTLLVMPASALADWRLSLGGSYRPTHFENIAVVNSGWALPMLDRRLSIVAHIDQRLSLTEWEDSAMQWTSQSFAGLGLEAAAKLGVYASATMGADLALLTVIEPTQEAYADIAALPAMKYQVGYRQQFGKWFGQLSVHGQTRFQATQLDVAPYLSRQTTGNIEWYEKTLPATTEMIQFVAFSIGYQF
ncbi:hypothetical protein [Salinibius halmophilus]|uniref:hypothetical protein n=1 Tax=Salinibius halmophilus TaxID=1853216 RepID=UPI000E6730BC|nr:hypothetical protein [Salinibius halmophilus]